jgi:phage shock protein E
LRFFNVGEVKVKTETRKLWSSVVILLVAAFALSACGGAPVAPAAEGAAVANNAAVPTKLPDTVDAKTVSELMTQDNVVVLDVREQSEYDQGHIPGVTLIPMGQVSDRLDEIPKDQTVIVTCRSGNRSAQVTDYLRGQGYTNVHNMEGGILAWEKAGLPVEQ